MSMMIADHWSHTLSFLVRFRDHFTGQIILEELPVRVVDPPLRPARAADGAYRQADGTYRFLDLGPGTFELAWRPALTTAEQGWTDHGQTLAVTTPLAQPTGIIDFELWPTPDRSVPTSMTAIRGRLIGLSAARRQVRIGAATVPQINHYTRTDSQGEFVFLLPGRWTRNPSGRINLRVEVDGGGVAGGASEPTSDIPGFVGAHFEAMPGRTTRINFRLT